MQLALPTKEFVPEGPDKPAGGYVQISTLTIGLLWWCYSEGLISLRAVRVGLALFEIRLRRVVHALVERKRGRRPESAPKFTVGELADYCGLPPKRARAALNELLALGLVAEFSETLIAFPRSLSSTALTEEQRAAFRAWMQRLTPRKRVPIPRRILALACESSGPALIAVILGACLRCCWQKSAGFTYSGRLSCSWLASRFRVSLRAVQSAKQHLMGLEWLRSKGTKDVSRFGELVEINPLWHRLISLPEAKGPENQDARGGGAPPGGTNSAGVPAPAGTNSAGVFLIESSLPPEEKSKDQRQSPAIRPEAGPGILIPSPLGRDSKTQDPTPAHRPLPSPRLSSLKPEDFSDVGRALELFRQAVKCGLMPNGSEHSRLLWMAAIERARTVGANNPFGIFLYIIKNRKWDYLSEGHFEAANARLKKHLFGRPEGAQPILVPKLRPVLEKPTPPEPPKHSRDAALVLAVRETLARKGLQGQSVFALLVRDAGWDRARYAAALAELEPIPALQESH